MVVAVNPLKVAAVLRDYEQVCARQRAKVGIDWPDISAEEVALMAKLEQRRQRELAEAYQAWERRTAIVTRK